MLPKEKVERINHLYKKSKTSGLTDEERKEQQRLRKEYVQSVRSSLTSHLLNMKVVDEKGRDVTPNKLKMAQNKRKKH